MKTSVHTLHVGETEMIKRYTHGEMGRIWSEENKFKTWLKIELLVCEAWHKLGKIPKTDFDNIEMFAGFDINRINEIEEVVKHDVIAFLTSVSESLGVESRFIHMGLTSSDILDTSLALLLVEASNILMFDLLNLASELRKKAFKYKNTIMIGRSHGIHAEPTTFGLRMALWYDETQRNIIRLLNATKSISVGKISGAVGTYANCPPYIEEYVCKKLELKPDSISTQIIQRDRHAEFMTTLAIIASSLDKFATEIRHLQRTEVLEVEEPFTKGQKGSSAMPHKRNPIKSENISGLARIIRGNSLVALENIPLWHDRDISHSSAERIILPDSTIALDHMILTMTYVIRDLNVYPENMIRNMNMSYGLHNSQKVMLALVGKKLSREESYKIVQENAMKAWREKTSFKNLLIEDERVCLTNEEIEDLFNDESFIKQVDYTFSKIFGG